jgi:hypothetical protein
MQYIQDDLFISDKVILKVLQFPEFQFNVTQGKMNFPISSILETYLRIPKVCSNFELTEEFSATKNNDPKNLQYFWNGPDIFRFVHFSGTVDFCDHQSSSSRINPVI